MTQLVRTLRLRDLVLLIIGSIIGSGIFLVPGGILRQVDHSIGIASLVWIAGGVLSLLGALSYSELAAMKPESGGLYVYVRDGFGPLPAFLYGWTMFLAIASGTMASLAVAFSTYLGEIVPLGPLAEKIIAIGVIAVITAVNVWGTRHSSDLQNWTTLAKVLLIVMLSAILLLLGHGYSAIPGSLWNENISGSLLSKFGLAMITVLWAYEGWQFVTYSAGEVIEPQKNFPRALFSSVLLMVGLYLVTNLRLPRRTRSGTRCGVGHDRREFHRIRARSFSGQIGVAHDPYFGFQRAQHRPSNRPARVLRHGQRRTFLR